MQDRPTSEAMHTPEEFQIRALEYESIILAHLPPVVNMWGTPVVIDSEEVANRIMENREIIIAIKERDNGIS